MLLMPLCRYSHSWFSSCCNVLLECITLAWVGFALSHVVDIFAQGYGSDGAVVMTYRAQLQQHKWHQKMPYKREPGLQPGISF